MNVIFKITSGLHAEVCRHLSKPHEFALERVGFISCAPSELEGGDLLILAKKFHPVKDENYVNDREVGARINSNAIREVMQYAYNNNVSMFHVHAHLHMGKPDFSKTDKVNNKNLIPCFWNVQPRLPHGAIVLSSNSLHGICHKSRGDGPIDVTRFVVVGRKITAIGEQL